MRERETRKQQLNEPYRTVLGHFRHEVEAHFYWDRLIRRFRPPRGIFAHFGSDEQQDYGAGLARSIIRNGPPQGLAATVYKCFYASHVHLGKRTVWQNRGLTIST